MFLFVMSLLIRYYLPQVLFFYLYLAYEYHNASCVDYQSSNIESVYLNTAQQDNSKGMKEDKRKKETGQMNR